MATIKIDVPDSVLTFEIGDLVLTVNNNDALLDRLEALKAELGKVKEDDYAKQAGKLLSKIVNEVFEGDSYQSVYKQCGKSTQVVEAVVLQIVDEIQKQRLATRRDDIISKYEGS